VVVTTPDIPSVTSATKIIDLAETHRVGVAGLVVNRVLNKKYELHMQEIESLCNTRIIAKIPEDPGVPESIAAKVPITMYYPSSPASLAITQLARELSGKRISQPQYARVGFFGRFLNFVKRVLRRS
jgi:MinD-like ATPase involved in chromosome partitioning or flagellar assembly